MAIAMGGKVAEELIFGDDKVTTGAVSDIEQATKRARAMVMRAGSKQRIRSCCVWRKRRRGFPWKISCSSTKYV